MLQIIMRISILAVTVPIVDAFGYLVLAFGGGGRRVVEDTRHFGDSLASRIRPRRMLDLGL